MIKLKRSVIVLKTKVTDIVVRPHCSYRIIVVLWITDVLWILSDHHIVSFGKSFKGGHNHSEGMSCLAYLEYFSRGAAKIQRGQMPSLIPRPARFFGRTSDKKLHGEGPGNKASKCPFHPLSFIDTDQTYIAFLDLRTSVCPY